MISKLIEKEKAIMLRKQGYSYNEILKEVPVAKSTLALWLQSVEMAEKHKIRLTLKRMAAAKRGGLAKRNYRIKTVNEINNKINNISYIVDDDNFWLIGLMLYWAEGAKTKSYHPSVDLKFSNSDPKMIKLFINWCRKFFNIGNERFDISLYIHENHKGNIDYFIKYWSNNIGLSADYFAKIYFKKHNLSTKRRNIGENYHGLIQVRVKASTNLNREVEAWINKICLYCGIV